MAAFCQGKQESTQLNWQRGISSPRTIELLKKTAQLPHSHSDLQSICFAHRGTSESALSELRKQKSTQKVHVLLSWTIAVSSNNYCPGFLIPLQAQLLLSSKDRGLTV